MEVIMQMGNELLVNLLVGVLSVLAALAICGVQKGIVYLILHRALKRCKH